MIPPFLRAIGVRGVLIGVSAAAVLVLVFVNRDLDTKLDRANLDLADKSAQIVALQNEAIELRNEIEAQRLAAMLDEQEATESFNDAQRSCDRRIRAAVEAVGAPLVNPTPEVSPDAPAGTAPVCDCPSRRLRDVAAPFSPK